MNDAIRTIKEFFCPSLKCKRLGHIYVVITIKIRKRSSEFREVVADYKAKFNRCSRCGFIELEPFDLEKIGSATSCTMPTLMWDSIREKGYVKV